jgi:hypothetical protein
MNEFAGDIAYVLEIALIGVGFVVLHFALKEGSKLMKIGAYVMLIGGVLGLVCTSMFWFKYWTAGHFDHPASVAVHVVEHDAESGHHFFPE